MINGTKILNEKLICNNCKKVVESVDNFCANCGNPLNDTASKFKFEYEKNIKLNVANEIIKLTTDPKLTLIINELIKRF